MSEQLFEENVPITPTGIFGAIDNQSVNRIAGESLIKRYGDLRVKEALADLQIKMGVDINEEAEKRMNRIGQLIDELHVKIISTYRLRKERKEKLSEIIFIFFQATAATLWARTGPE
jgi:hypothetical protein